MLFNITGDLFIKYMLENIIPFDECAKCYDVALECNPTAHKTLRNFGMLQT